MRLARVDVQARTLPLARPYAIAYASTDEAPLVFLRLAAEDGTPGLGCAAPVAAITGESPADCLRALRSCAQLVGAEADPGAPAAAELLRALSATPAAQAALDMALHDLAARRAGAPLCVWLGGAPRELPTTITIGVKSVAEALAEADEYVARGFRAIKVKIGAEPDADLALLARLREHVGGGITLRADANAGYRATDVQRFWERAAGLGLELLEQPCAPGEDDALRRLPDAIRRRLAADESLHGEEDAARLAREPRPYGIWNIKLMKCGGVGPALRIARVAERNGVELMWGCMDESAISIAAALHAAYASHASAYLDLDGSLDLVGDPARGGFALDAGRMRALGVPGLGVELEP